MLRKALRASLVASLRYALTHALRLCGAYQRQLMPDAYVASLHASEGTNALRLLASPQTPRCRAARVFALRAQTLASERVKFKNLVEVSLRVSKFHLVSVFVCPAPFFQRG